MRVFVSATTQQLADCRRQVASDLRAALADVDVQDDFRQGRGTLIQKLQDVAGADLVVAMVGIALGQLALDDAVPKTDPPRSWTQWEWYFAMGERLTGEPRAARKNVLLYIASEKFCREHPVEQTPEAAESQRRFVDVIKQTGEQYTTFDTLDQLRANVLRDVAEFSNRPRRPQNLPYRPLGELFKGRAEFLEKMRQSFARPLPNGGPRATAITATQAVHGLGGIGKTRTAVEYAWENERQYTALLFVRADSPQTLERSLAALCGPLVLNLPLNPDTKQPDQAAAAVAWMQDHSGWFLLIDNADSHDAQRAVHSLLGHLGNAGHVLITSRRDDWPQGVEPLKLGVLAHADAVDYLLKATEAKRTKTPTDATDADELTGHLDGLALALEQSAAVINHRSLSLGDYLERWLADDQRVRDWPKEALRDYPLSVATTWLVTFEQLSQNAMTLLRVLANFAPDAIPRELVCSERAGRAIAGLLNPDADNPEPADAEEALAELAACSMITWDESRSSFGVHRLVSKVTRDRTEAAQAPLLASAAVAILNAFVPGDPPPDDVRSWPRWKAVAAHAGSAVERADRLGAGVAASRLMSELALYAMTRGTRAEAEPLMRRALAIDEASYGKDHPNVAIRLNNLASLLQATNRVGEAEPLMRRALAIDEASYGKDHPEVATDLNNLASLLQATNRLAEAEPLMRRVVEIFEKSLGKDHPNVASALNNLAQLLQATNRLAEAEPLMRRALAIDEASYGKDHPNVAIRLNNLASLLQATNRLAEAEPLMRRALAIDEASYGKDHPNVAIRLNNLASLLQATNRLGEAEPLMRRALAIDEASYGKDHPNVAIRLNNLASLLYSTNRLAEAEPLMRRTLEIFLKFTARTGHQHPHLMAAAQNYTILLIESGVPQAEAVRRVVDLFKTYGISISAG